MPIVNVSSKKVIEAFTEPAMLKNWWGVERCFIEKRSGGIYTLLWDISAKGFGYVSTGIVKSYSPGSTLEIEKFIYMNPDKSILGPMELLIKAEENDGDTELYLCQSGYQKGGDWHWYYEAVKEAWPLTLKKLKGFLETE